MPWEVLDAAELRRNRQRREPGSGRRIEWPVSLRTRMKFRELLAELVDLDTHPASLELETRKEMLREEIRSLPGFPRKFDAERDVIVPLTTSIQR